MLDQIEMKYQISDTIWLRWQRNR